MEVNKNFENEYLVSGNTYDNFIFENCPKEFLGYAREKLSQSNNDITPCVVNIDGKIDRLVGNTLNNFDDDFHKKILARDFVTAMVVREILKNFCDVEQSQELVEMQINGFLSNDPHCVKGLHPYSFLPYNVRTLSSSIGKIELDFILEDVQNKYIQQAINVFISSREPYSVKIFTSDEYLSSYYDLDGNLIQAPHDFMRRDIVQFINESEINALKEKQ